MSVARRLAVLSAALLSVLIAACSVPTSDSTQRPSTVAQTEQKLAFPVAGTQFTDPKGSLTAGVKFTTAKSGKIVGVEFHRFSTANTTQAVQLWSPTGTLLASASTPNRTMLGFNRATFSTPVTVAAGQTFTASYLTPKGTYTARNDAFTAPRVTGDLTAPISAGVYAYGTKAVFPTQSFRNTDYYVTPVFVADLTPPTSTSTTTPPTSSTAPPTSTVPPTSTTTVPASTTPPTSTIPPTTTTTPPGGGIDALPRVPWEGGASYYSQFPNAHAGGWDNPNFFPIGVWYNGASSDEEVQWDKSMGINTYMGQPPTDAGALGRNGMYWIGGPPSGLDPASPQWVGNFLDDEVDGRFSPADGRNYLQGLKDQYAGNGKFNYANFTNTVTQTAMASSDAEAYVNNYTDTVSLDMYFDTVPFCGWNPYPTSFFIEGVPQSTCRTAASYGAEIRMLRARDAVDGKLQPIWQFVENLSGAPAEGPYAIATPAQIKGAAMDSVINEARGLIWFNTSFGGSCPAQPVIRRAQVEGTSFCGWNQVQAMKEINLQLQSLAPILNTQSYAYTFNPALDTMLKKGPDGAAYIFTMLKNGTGPGVQELTLPAGVTATQVEVLNENRTIPIVAGKFSDNIDTDTYHIYKIAL